MAEIKRTVTETKAQGVDETGSKVQQQTQRIQTDAKADTKTTAQNVVWYVLGVVEAILLLRLLLKLFGANPANGFVDFVYSVSGVLSGPFDNIFGVASTTAGEVRSVFEPSIVVAGIVYALIAWGIVKLITINQKA